MATARARQARTEGSVKPEGQWHHGDLRASLIQWGTHLLDTEGVDGMSMRAAAKLAGVSQGAPAHHFKDRNGLLAAIAAQGFRDMAAWRRKRTDGVGAGADDASSRLRRAMLSYLAFAVAHPARFHLMFSPQIENREQYPELLEASAASFALLRSAVEPFVPSARAKALSAQDLSFAVWVATHGMATLAIQGRTSPGHASQARTPDQLAEVVVQFCLAALR